MTPKRGLGSTERVMSLGGLDRKVSGSREDPSFTDVKKRCDKRVTVTRLAGRSCRLKRSIVKEMSLPC